MIRCVIVDDEEPARERLRRLLDQTDAAVEVLGEAGGGEEAVSLIHRLAPELVFLDIHMPLLDGFDVVDLLMPPRPAIIFTTAYDAYALQAFEVHALDYLTKPIRLERLNRALRHVGDAASRREQTAALEELQRARAVPLRRMTVQAGDRLRVLQDHEILYVEAEDRLVFVSTESGRHVTSFTLDELERRLDPEHFVRVHRSYLVNLRYVRELIPWFSDTYRIRIKGGTELPVSRRRVQTVKQRLGG